MHGARGQPQWLRSHLGCRLGAEELRLRNDEFETHSRGPRAVTRNERSFDDQDS
jgi:hypothetical protein